MQTKVSVSQPGDAFEREADLVAQRVASGGYALPVSRLPAGPLQRMPAAPIDAKLVELPAERATQMSEGGAPMSPGTRDTLESRLDANLGAVRVHEGPAAQQAAFSLGARAFTRGNHIFLGEGESQSDLPLMAHETTHVLQQGGASQPSAPQVQRSGLGVVGKLLNKFAQHIPGYSLFTVIVGSNPLTGEAVPRTAVNLVGGLLGLIPGGGALFDRLNESGALEKALAWINQQIKDLDITFDGLVALAEQAWDKVSVWNTFTENLNIVVAVFAPPFNRAVNFAVQLGKKIAEFVIESVLTLAGPLGARILAILKKAGDSFFTIVNDPIGFIGNLISALGKGFNQFSQNILTHLKEGIFGWLFGALKGAGIQLPEKFDLEGIVSVVLQVLGLTYQHLRAKLVKIAGEERVAQIEKAVEFLRILVTKGLAGAWEKIVEYVGSLQDMVVGAIRDWVVKNIVTTAIVKLVAMFNPAGAVIQAIKAVYDTIKFFIERLEQILDLAESVFDSIGRIAAGKLEDAANFVEKTMARTIPVIIAFLAELIGLGGISDEIKKIIKEIQARVSDAIDKLVDFIMEEAGALFQKGAGVVERVKEWWIKPVPVHIGSEEHELSLAEDQPEGDVMLASGRPRPLAAFLSGLKDPEDHAAIAEANKLSDQIKQTWMDARKKGYGQERGEAIRVLLEKLAAVLANLKAGATFLPPTMVTWTTHPTNEPTLGLSSVDGLSMTADPLSFNPGPFAGSQPYEESGLWKAVNRRPDTYVRGHLLNHMVHGPGSIENLTPLTRSYNTRMERDFERDVKDAVLNDKKVLKYVVTANYDRDKSRTSLPAENFIAKSLTLSAKVLEPIDENVKDDPKKAEKRENWKETKNLFAPVTRDIDLPEDKKP